MEKRLPKGYFFKNGVPTVENVMSWLCYFDSGGSVDDKKINLDAFKCVRERMGWESENNGLLCFSWGIDENALNSKSTGEYAKSMIETKKLAWEIKQIIGPKVQERSDILMGIIRRKDSIIETSDFIMSYNNRLYETGDIRYFFMKKGENDLPSLHFNYGKYKGKSFLDVIDEDINYMLYVVGDKTDISDWVKSDLWDFIIPKLEKKKETHKKVA